MQLVYHFIGKVSIIERQKLDKILGALGKRHLSGKAGGGFLIAKKNTACLAVFATFGADFTRNNKRSWRILP